PRPLDFPPPETYDNVQEFRKSVAPLAGAARTGCAPRWPHMPHPPQALSRVTVVPNPGREKRIFGVVSYQTRGGQRSLIRKRKPAGTLLRLARAKARKKSGQSRTLPARKKPPGGRSGHLHPQEPHLPVQVRAVQPQQPRRVRHVPPRPLD